MHGFACTFLTHLRLNLQLPESREQLAPLAVEPEEEDNGSRTPERADQPPGTALLEQVSERLLDVAAGDHRDDESSNQGDEDADRQTDFDRRLELTVNHGPDAHEGTEHQSNDQHEAGCRPRELAVGDNDRQDADDGVDGEHGRHADDALHSDLLGRRRGALQVLLRRVFSSWFTRVSAQGQGSKVYLLHCLYA